MAGLSAQQAVKKPSNFKRKQTDYLWLLGFLAVFVAIGEYLYPERSSAADRQQFYEQIALKPFLEPFGITGPSGVWVWVAWASLTSLALTSITTAMFFAFLWINPDKTPTTHVASQVKAISVNFVLLPIMQTIGDYLVVQGYTKNTMGNLTLWEMARDSCLWMLMFEWAWYTQHRAMHDNKFLWTLGHSYHHGWKKPEHMIGITNFAFDHIVEIWVTMSSSFIGYLIFPGNFWVVKTISLGYMILAVLAHWDPFPSKYHLNHHYLVIKNYGSHWPIFDMFFGTYQSEEYIHPDNRVKAE